jgi:hypothetical protein
VIRAEFNPLTLESGTRQNIGASRRDGHRSGRSSTWIEDRCKQMKQIAVCARPAPRR